MAEAAGWGAWVRMIPSLGETSVGELGRSTVNPGREGMAGSWEVTCSPVERTGGKGQAA